MDKGFELVAVRNELDFKLALSIKHSTCQVMIRSTIDATSLKRTHVFLPITCLHFSKKIMQSFILTLVGFPKATILMLDSLLAFLLIFLTL